MLDSVSLPHAFWRNSCTNFSGSQTASTQNLNFKAQTTEMNPQAVDPGPEPRSLKANQNPEPKR